MQRSLDVKTCETARLSRDARFDGKFFTGVITTGIFCRPICPARPPKPENVQYYLSAEQAQHAGFTPCKRCFPEQAAVKNLPIKLKRIIQSFDYKSDNLTTISAKFAISTRQLQRLFQQYYGLSPSEYFQQQRLLLARKLISTTKLSLSDICFASGFNSVRRFNEAIKKAYQCSPKLLRKSKNIIKDNECLTINLPYRPPFDWSTMLTFFQNRQIKGLEKVTSNSYQRSISIDKCTGWLVITHHPKKPALTMKIVLSDYSYLSNVINRIRRMFDLDADMDLIHQQLSQHPLLKKIINQHQGLRLPGCWDIFEFSIRAILGQQISVKGATTLAKRITEKYGQQSPELPSETRLIFPSVEALLGVEYEGIGLTKTRIATLQRWVEFFELHHEKIENYPSLERLEKQLCEIKGIGPWTVNYLAMRGLSDPDAFPSADLGVIKALSNNEKKISNKEILQLAEQWRPWRAYACIYLWHSLAH
ncbi:MULTISPECIES: AlkA N-terminal domain-containing protein [Thalassotalea]|uniref:DNA-3-methyladenine glycosylase II n=1 Tax=Thalassotalea castellviae TaxID=3075612 RepID=A0ABU3A1B7_9GAMM|nr:AlkA N-terminal domain-containing protein [Thalassotalea sp. W431]MDT0603575.1 AlkA N-terminal domain-containing protein [Thalassotalea sp. W431]